VIDYDTQVSNLQSRLERYFSNICLTEQKLITEVEGVRHEGQLIFINDPYNHETDYTEHPVLRFVGCRRYDYDPLGFVIGDYGLSVKVRDFVEVYVSHNPLWHYAKFMERLVLETYDELAALKEEDQKHTRLIREINSSTKVNYV
jgi:hypothetical protein